MSKVDKPTLPTKYAPAERASEIELRKQIEFFNKNNLADFLLGSMPVNMTILNSCRQIVYTNRQFAEFLEIKERETIYGFRVGEAVNCIHSKESEGGCGTTEFCSKCGAVNAILSSLKGKDSAKECRITVENGSALDLMVWGRHLNYKGEDFSVFSFVDISDAMRRYALERIFFHDVLNTAGSLRSFIELVNDAENEENRIELIKYAYEIAQNLVDEISEQRDLVAAENNDLTLSIERFSALELLEIVQRQFAFSDKYNKNNVVIHSGSEDVEVTADKILLSRVIVNMVKNAIEASEEGDEIVTGINLIGGNKIQFMVHNNSAMPKDVQLQIFQRSFSTKGKGRGLGTYSMKLLSEKYLKGTITFTSVEGAGTTFYATYPVNLNEN